MNNLVVRMIHSHQKYLMHTIFIFFFDMVYRTVSVFSLRCLRLLYIYRHVFAYFIVNYSKILAYNENVQWFFFSKFRHQKSNQKKVLAFNEDMYMYSLDYMTSFDSSIHFVLVCFFSKNDNQSNGARPWKLWEEFTTVWNQRETRQWTERRKPGGSGSQNRQKT